ncbi:hypothetical protein [Dictyobacter vulcani]|nr:hypothetical protein [Dictyobacter vulcani]
MQKAKFRLSGWLTLALCLVLFTFVLSACGTTGQASSTPAAKQATPTLH